MGFRGRDEFGTDPTGRLAQGAPMAGDSGRGGVMGSGVGVGRIGLPVGSAAVPGQTGGTGMGATIGFPIGGGGGSGSTGTAGASAINIPRGTGPVQKRAKGGKISAVTAVHKHEKNMHKGKKLTKMAKGGSTASKRADGIAKKGRTRGKMV